MESNFNIMEYLIQQAPVVVVMAIVCYQGFKYFKGRETSQQAIISKKDDEIKLLNRESKEDLQKSFVVLQDVAGTLSAWIDKDDKNFELKKEINTSLTELKLTSNSIQAKLDKQ